VERRLIRISDIRSDTEHYQRPVNNRIVNEITDNFSTDLFGIPCVNQRPDGKLYLVDGQHRIAAATRKFGPDHVVECEVLHLRGPREEARIFRLRNLVRCSPTKQVLFKGALTERDPVALEIRDILREYGLTIHLEGRVAPTKDHITNTGGMETVRARYGAQGLRKTLDLVTTCWRGQGYATSSQVLVGVAEFLKRCSDQTAFRYDRVTTIFRGIPLDTVRARAQSLRMKEPITFSAAIASAMVCLHNENAGRGRSKLSWGVKTEASP
jgi:hypothetical protein